MSNPTTLNHPLVDELGRHGVRFRRFAIEHDSPHRLEDWDWNQRDLPHVAFIHGAFQAAPVEVRDDRITLVTLQRLFGFRVPLLNAYSHATPTQRAYVTTLGPFTLLVEASLERLDGGGTRVRTAYSVGALSPFHWLLPIVERYLRRNYRQVHAEDEPLRARRSELRSWGYRFKDDAEGASYAGSTQLSVDGVQCPELVPAAATLRLDSLRAGEQVLLGRSDHVGLRVVREPSRLVVYPRLCPHQGACLDEPLEQADVLRCPWHGRAVEPLCVFALGHAEPQRASTAFHELTLQDDELQVAPRKLESQRQPANGSVEREAVRSTRG